MSLYDLQNLAWHDDLWDAVATPVKGLFGFGKKAVGKHKKSMVKDLRYTKNYLDAHGDFVGAGALANSLGELQGSVEATMEKEMLMDLRRNRSRRGRRPLKKKPTLMDLRRKRSCRGRKSCNKSKKHILLLV